MNAISLHDAPVDPSLVSQIISNAFSLIDQLILEHATELDKIDCDLYGRRKVSKKNNRHAGSCVVILLIVEDYMYVAHVG
jgi:hypothetical protein